MASTHKDVEHVGLHLVDRHEARVAVVHEQLAPQRGGREVVDTAGAIRDVSHDDGGDARKALEDICDGGGKDEESLRELECHARRVELSQPPDRLWDLEIVV